MKDFNPVHIREWWAGPLFDRARPWEWFQPPKIELEKNIFWDISGTFFHMKEIGIHFYIFLLFIFDLLSPKWGVGGQIYPQSFSWTPGVSDLLKKGRKIKFYLKSVFFDPV